MEDQEVEDKAVESPANNVNTMDNGKSMETLTSPIVFAFKTSSRQELGLIRARGSGKRTSGALPSASSSLSED